MQSKFSLRKLICQICRKAMEPIYRSSVAVGQYQSVGKTGHLIRLVCCWPATQTTNKKKTTSKNYSLDSEDDLCMDLDKTVFTQLNAANWGKINNEGCTQPQQWEGSRGLEGKRSTIPFIFWPRKTYWNLTTIPFEIIITFYLLLTNLRDMIFKYTQPLNKRCIETLKIG